MTTSPRRNRITNVHTTSSSSGPWKISFAAPLALLCCLGLFGCHTRTPLPVAWVRVETLAALHPSQGMLTDLDYQVSRLQAQRRRLLASSAPPTAPDAVRLQLPAEPALPSPTPVVLHPCAPDALIDQDVKALERTLKRQSDAEYADFRDGVREDAAQKLQDTLAGLEQDAQQHRLEIARAYRTRIRGGEVRYENALQASQVARGYADLHPENPNAIEQARRAKELCAEVYWELKDSKLAYQEALRQVDATLAQARQQAEQASKQAVIAQLDARKAKDAAEVKLKFAAERARLAREATLISCPTAPTPLVFPADGARQLALDAGGLHPTAQAMQASDAIGRADSVRQIDRDIAALTAERCKTLATIDQDTRAAIQSLADQHRYRVLFLPGHGKDLTASMSKWLREYWKI